jgi:hypothetical protein
VIREGMAKDEVLRLVGAPSEIQRPPVAKAGCKEEFIYEVRYQNRVLARWYSSGKQEVTVCFDEQEQVKSTGFGLVSY